MNPKKISIIDYTYSLPEDRIANYPLKERDASKLLIYQNAEIKEDLYKNIAEYLPSHSLMVFNNTRVVEARILFKKSTGAQIEIFCLEPGPEYRDISTALAQTGSVNWLCLIGGASKWKHGLVLEKKIEYAGESIQLSVKYKEKIADSFLIEISWTPSHFTFAEILHAAGSVPLPPYIKRKAVLEDAERYQTIYADVEGSVAAPTAGLHFTPAILSQLELKRIQTAYLTLHVGSATFKPVKSETMEGHEMHSEFIDLPMDLLDKLITGGFNSITAVGTTSFRTLESLYWLGVKTITNPEIRSDELYLNQWEAYELTAEHSTRKCLIALKSWMLKNQFERLFTRTRLLIVPGYRFKVVDALVTNFHQPQSTLLLLVAAFIGEDWRKVYQYALDNEFRFLSYGDGNLYFTPRPPKGGAQVDDHD